MWSVLTGWVVWVFIMIVGYSNRGSSTANMNFLFFFFPIKSCIRGYNEHYIPTYQWHGCCDDTDPLCRSVSYKCMSDTVKILKVRTSENCCKHAKIEQSGFTIEM